MSYRNIWLLFMIIIPSSVFSTDDLYERCNRPFTCGDQPELFYPFWRSGREDCGHPDFKLDCSGAYAEFTISSVKYRVLNIEPSYIRVARSDYIDSLCPAEPPNAIFNDSVLPFTSDTDLLTLYYNCIDFSPPNFGSSYFGELDCNDAEKDYFLTRNFSSPSLSNLGGFLRKVICTTNVSIPASRPELDTLQRNPNQDNLKKALTEGFKLEFNQNCLRCIESKGACGYNQSSDGFACYCTHGRHSNSTCSSSKKDSGGGCGYNVSSDGFACYCTHGRHSNSTCSSSKKGLNTGAIAGIGIASVVVVAILISAGLFCINRRRRKESYYPTKQKPKYPRKKKLKDLIPLKHYSYAKVMRITKSFAEVVGKGGFGIVYKGTLCDGRSVAVKILKDSKGNGEDFINEIASMSKTSHVNIVNLLGFCSEGSKRAIIYEFLENGSLDQFISSKNSMTLDWMTLYKIALGVARGLEYLHYGCKTRIVHFDIKPQNVLLDAEFCPKVSDFGLAKLCEKKESILSLLDTRGTIGYIAPEVFSRMFGTVSHKSDVYSFGMLVLEMIGARNKERCDKKSTSNTSSMYFPDWIYKDLEKRDSVINNEDGELPKKMTLVGLWCVQTSPSDRPAMNKIVEMLEGSVDALEVPPRPVFQVPAVPLQESSTLSEDISVYTE